MRLFNDVSASPDCSVVHRVDVVCDDIQRSGAKPGMDAVDVLGATEQERTTARPTKLRMDDVVNVVPHDNGLAEAENVHQESAGRLRVVVVNDRPE